MASKPCWSDTECIDHSGLTLDILQKLTGIHRTKLGRMRLCKCQVTCDEADQVFLAVRRPRRAPMMLALLGEENHFTPQAMAYLDNFLSDIRSLLTRLN